ncbi:MAG: hypothetical protein AAFN74_21750 [Myxococcota bacterium]
MKTTNDRADWSLPDRLSELLLNAVESWRRYDALTEEEPEHFSWNRDLILVEDRAGRIAANALGALIYDRNHEGGVATHWPVSLAVDAPEWMQTVETFASGRVWKLFEVEAGSEAHDSIGRILKDYRARVLEDTKGVRPGFVFDWDGYESIARFSMRLEGPNK